MTAEIAEFPENGMQLERATERLRALVLAGAFPPDEKLAETRVAELLGVSRTPARLAMAALEQEGLLARLPRRGFRLRSFTLDEVVEAIEVRGELEALAARFAAERGLDPAHRSRMEACIGRAEVLLAAHPFDPQQRLDWCRANAEFHATLVAAARVSSLAAAYAQVNLVPLAQPSAIIFNVAHAELGRRQLEASHEDHTRILEAILGRKSTRAAALVREHAYRSGENKRRNFPDLRGQSLVLEAPGIALVRAG